MPSTHSEKSEAFGFLTVLEHDRFGLFGGYLLLNAAGRPLEFHCTTPVKPNRAQTILYGNTLKAFLYGEQIGQTLIAKSKRQPLAIFTNQPPVLAAQEFLSIPMIYLAGEIDESETPATDDRKYLQGWKSRKIAERQLFVPDQMRHSAESVCEMISSKLERLDLFEPFGRISLAIEEAQRAA